MADTVKKPAAKKAGMVTHTAAAPAPAVPKDFKKSQTKEAILARTHKPKRKCTPKTVLPYRKKSYGRLWAKAVFTKRGLSNPHAMLLFIEKTADGNKNDYVRH